MYREGFSKKKKILPTVVKFQPTTCFNQHSVLRKRFLIFILYHFRLFLQFYIKKEDYWYQID
jgi:hypothetical protein